MNKYDSPMNICYLTMHHSNIIHSIFEYYCCQLVHAFYNSPKEFGRENQTEEKNELEV